MPLFCSSVQCATNVRDRWTKIFLDFCIAIMIKYIGVTIDTQKMEGMQRRTKNDDQQKTDANRN